jgi:XTP/dITP diphosphohydrolase
MQALVIATHNAHKTEEIADILGGFFAEVRDLSAYPEIPPADETGDTFEANARIKALAASEALGPGALVLSDDSGLEVDALGGAPGVRSARYSGEGATDATNRARLLAALAEKGARGKARSGRFRCTMVLARAGAVLGIFDGAVEGILINEEKGAGGFGYDSLFVPDGHCETFAQLGAEVKNGLSHRARALEKVRGFLEGAGE